MRKSCGRNIAAARGLAALPWRVAIVSAAAIMALPLMAEDLATSAAYDFWLDTGARPFALSSQSAVSSFAAHFVTYRAGETVTAVAPDDSRVELVAPGAPSAGSVSFAPTTDGLWRLENSNGSAVIVGVGWGVFGGGWSYDFSLVSLFWLHTMGDGPNRRVQAQKYPGVAYSGDHWRRNAGAGSTLTFFAPNGQSTVFDLGGTGVQPFKFNQAGIWTVRLAMADDTTLEAEIAASAGFVLFFR